MTTLTGIHLLFPPVIGIPYFPHLKIYSSTEPTRFERVWAPPKRAELPITPWFKLKPFFLIVSIGDLDSIRF